MNILEILKYTKGSLNKLDLKLKINSFKTNSKEINKNDCFVSLNDKYIDEAIKNGACLIITSSNKKYKVPTITVQDVIKTLGDLASLIRDKYNFKVIAITGSVGKTTTRELIYTILKNKYNVIQSEKNYNNHIGVPLTMFRVNKNTEIVITEMGMNHFNEIKYLSKMVKPDIAVITNIGSSHIGNLGSRENILKAKLEILEGLKDKLFVNGDDDLLKYLNVNLSKSGFSKGNNLMGYNLYSNFDYSTFEIDKYKFKVNLPRHLLNDVLIAIDVCLYFGVDINTIIKALREYKTFDKRMNVIYKSSNIIINDCYNSSYESVIGALEYVHKSKLDKLLILGDIKELGNYSYEIHEKIVNLIKDENVILVGDEFKKVKDNLLHFNNYKEVINYLKNKKIENTIILIKASRSMHFENITDFLINNKLL